MITRPNSRRTRVMESYDYKFFCFDMGENGLISLILRASGPTAIEIQTLISYPDRKGNGRAIMKRLCALADELGVECWLDAYPFGSDREHISLAKLKEFYRSFNFFPVKQVNRNLLCGFHQWERVRFKNLMLRTPVAIVLGW